MRWLIRAGDPLTIDEEQSDGCITACSRSDAVKLSTAAPQSVEAVTFATLVAFICTSQICFEEIVIDSNLSGIDLRGVPDTPTRNSTATNARRVTTPQEGGRDWTYAPNFVSVTSARGCLLTCSKSASATRSFCNDRCAQNYEEVDCAANYPEEA